MNFNSGGMGSGIGGFINQGLQYNGQSAQMGQMIGQQGMQDMQQVQALQMKMQTEQGMLNLMTKLNEALAKCFKAIGDAIKGLVG